MTSAYLNTIDIFNKISGFRILKPINDDITKKLEPYTCKIKELIKDLERYEYIRSKGFSDDHLATEIGLFVMHINQISNGIVDVCILDDH
tara:strand:- start:355 stop:624 length:270 start_codon:yes stop_codon:yes gene_type:complete